MTMPSVEVIPTLRPRPLKMCAIIRDVVVLPLVPVTATIGTRDGAPGGKSRSTTGLAMNCGTPTVGWVCIRKPGAALTSQIAPPVSRTGEAMSGQMKSMPATSRPTIRAASSAISTLSGWASKVRSMEMPPVDMLPVSASLTISPAAAPTSARSPGRATSSSAASSTLIRVSTFSCPTPRRGSALVMLDEVGDGVLAVADDVGRDALGDGGHAAADDEAAVVLPVTKDSTMSVPRRDSRLGDVERALDVVLGAAGRGRRPRPWLPSSGLTTTGKPIRAGRLRPRRPSCAPSPGVGTGRPAEGRAACAVRSLSLAMSTASAEVCEVIVARMRCACTP